MPLADDSRLRANGNSALSFVFTLGTQTRKKLRSLRQSWVVWNIVSRFGESRVKLGVPDVFSFLTKNRMAKKKREKEIRIRLNV